MQKQRIANKLLDKIHRGVVWTCMGITVVGTGYLGYRAYRYFTVVKPMRQQQELKMIEEGTMQDKAPDLKM